MKLCKSMTNVLISNYLLSAVSLNFPPCLYLRLSSQLCGSDTTGARPVASRHVTSREKQHKPSERNEGGRPKKEKEKAHRKTPTT